MKKLSILVSSKGKNQELAVIIKDQAIKQKFSVEIINLVDLNLPLYSSEEEKDSIPESALSLTKKITASDSLVVISPEYNGSMAPVLNNAIAWISRSTENWRGAFNAKPTLLATHSGGGGSYVLLAMRQQLSYIGANVIGRQLLTTYSKEVNLESVESCLNQL